MRLGRAEEIKTVLKWADVRPEIGSLPKNSRRELGSWVRVRVIRSQQFHCYSSRYSCRFCGLLTLWCFGK